MQKGSKVKCKYILRSVYQYCNVQLLSPFNFYYFNAMIRFCLLFWIPNFVLPATTKKDKIKKRRAIAAPSDDDDDDDDDSYDEEPPPKKSKVRKPITLACKIYIYFDEVP